MREELHDQYQKLLTLLKEASKSRLLHLESALEEAAKFFELVADEVQDAAEAKKHDLQQMIANIDQVLKDATTASSGKEAHSEGGFIPKRDEERMRRALTRMMAASSKIKKAFGEHEDVKPSLPSRKEPAEAKKKPRQKKGWMKS